MILNERARSRTQQRLFGMVYAYRKGRLKKSEVPPIVIKIANSKIKDKSVEDFARTKHRGLPERINKKKRKKLLKNEEKIINNNMNNFNLKLIEERLVPENFNEVIENIKEEFNLTDYEFNLIIEDFYNKSIDELNEYEKYELLNRLPKIFEHEFKNEIYEGKIKDEKSFKDWLKAKLKKMHGDNYDDKKAEDMFKDLMRRKKEENLEWGNLIGIVNRG